MDEEPTPDERGDDDDLDGYQTSLSRLVDRARGWLALLVAAMLVVPLASWAVDELAFRRSGTSVEESLGEDRDLAQAVFLVRASRCDGGGGSGSGFVLGEGDDRVIVTNRHVVEGAGTVSVRPLAGGQAIEVVRYRISDTADVAILEPADPSALPAGLALGPAVDEGAEVRVVGFPAAMPFTTAGRVAEASAGRLLLDLRIDPGASGSPVVDGDGDVVGQVFARTDDGRGVATGVGALSDAVGDARPVDPGC